ncbi:Putative fibronectin domain-containing lipoprotein [Helicobacter ailurogastricus]|uniref:Putative fibronectin domain-containing lipoprotein n=1 Tax=Helicobacter ailurogastricus TaxID=1578720 RepID=A0A0K2X8I2_9HELI|nr:Putative fibronectin domain-containing lipoprotein [Helicobacter ailurogastricus]CRF42317.1 Putative fibronectin domain-containing lipoprotein [Helicobacter ailurogastricus]CRF44785.1 Putative fibronectin domain-containing lipoprotein [Helicobacter ailurogastricus]CRF51996.1 Putative fibronectin domain-containing lipoprotein [Helicobacter ailurogastricus]
MGLILSNCAHPRKNNTLSFNQQQETMNANLPVVQGIRTINDVESVGFEWQPVGNPGLIDGFAIYRMQKDQVYRRVATIRNPLATHYYDDGLTPQTDYTYQIATIGKNGGVSQMSAPILVHTSYINPVERVFASQESPKEIKIFWSPHPNPSIARYIVQRESADGKFSNIGVVKNRLYVEYFDKNLPDGAKQRYRVIAESFEGAKSLPSAIVEGQTKPLPLPLSNLQASTNLTRKIELSWAPSSQSDVALYRVYATNRIDGHFKSIAETKEPHYTDEVDADGASRFYKVVAVDKNGLEGVMPTESIKGVTLPRPTPPIITKGTIEDGQAIIEWQSVPDKRVKGYAVYRFDGNSNSSPVRFGNLTNTQFIDKNMANGQKYRYQVVSIDAAGLESRPSKEVELRLDR